MLPLSRGKGMIIVAGMPKSGTTAIARLLGEVSGSSVCSDPFHKLDKLGLSYRDMLFTDRYFLKSIWKSYRHIFSGRIVKDPNFPLLMAQIVEMFPESRRVFIVRDPRDNIRSILNRLDIPGDPRLGEVKMRDVSGAWANVLNGVSPKMRGNNYLEKMAWRWRVSCEEYMADKNSIFLIRYEDFSSDKRGAVENLASSLGLPILHDISQRVDVQFQPKGQQVTNYSNFFGPENLGLINAIVAPLLSEFGYE